jgi:multidrug efflux pump subunit AcrA (membrane-fusion protein)
LCRLVERDVRLGDAIGNDVVVVSGVQVGDKIVAAADGGRRTNFSTAGRKRAERPRSEGTRHAAGDTNRRS